MKKVTTFNKKSVYSDIDPITTNATFFKYVGKTRGTICFHYIGGEDGYLYTRHPKYGRIIEFCAPISKYELSTDEAVELLKQDRITI